MCRMTMAIDTAIAGHRGDNNMAAEKKDHANSNPRLEGQGMLLKQPVKRRTVFHHKLVVALPILRVLPK